MKCASPIILVFIFTALAQASDSKSAPTLDPGVTRVSTSLDHLTVLEFSEPVTMAATGSSAFQIERHGNKVFIKPLRTGAATDLFIWTATRRFAYELMPPGEIHDMNFAIDNSVASAKPAPVSTEIDQVADIILTRALLGAERIDSSLVKDDKNAMTVRMEQVFRTAQSTYIHYSVQNASARAFIVVQPQVVILDAPKPKVSPYSMEQKQLSEREVHSLGTLNQQILAVAHFETQAGTLQAHHETQCVVSVRRKLTSPTLVQLIFMLEGGRQLRATAVF